MRTARGLAVVAMVAGASCVSAPTTVLERLSRWRRSKRVARAGDRWRIEALAAPVLSSARETQALQAPHIVEPDDEAMTRIEKRMSASEEGARQALTALTGAVPPQLLCDTRECGESPARKDRVP